MNAKVAVPLVGLVLVGVAAVVALVAWLSTPDVPSMALSAPVFADETAPSGVNHTYDGDWTFYVGGGVATFDCNDDRLPELFLAGGANESALLVNESEVGGTLRFADVSGPATAITEVTGAYPIDIDSDGVLDLVVLRNGPNRVLRGTGGCGFEEATDDWGIDPGDAWTTAFSATWADGDEMPTLAFGNYVLLDEQGRQNGDCYDNVLQIPEGDRYGDPILLTPGWCTLSMLFSDWSRTGQRDLRISNDRHYYRNGEEQLWRLSPGSDPALYTESEGWNSLQIWGMGIASYDTTGDGYPEVFLTSQGDNKLQTLDGDGSEPDFVDIAIRSGVTAHRPFAGGDIMPSTAWHPEFEDVNNDGFVDLYISKGNVDEDPGFAADDPNNLLLGQPDGTFIESAEDANLLTFSKTRGAAVVDLNLDGLLDLVEVNREETVRIWRNDGLGDTGASEPQWVGVSVSQDGGNVDAIGSWVELRVGDYHAEREVTIGGGHLSGGIGPIHFGLGPSANAEVRVTWPDGTTTDWFKVDAGRYYSVERGTQAPTVLSP